MLRYFLIVCVLILHSCCATSRAQSEVHAFIGATLTPISSEPISDGVMLVEHGHILRVGRASDIAIPNGAIRHDVSGKVIMPGLVDTHNHVGGIGGADRTGPIQPDVRIFDSINVRDAGFKRTVAGGITTINVMPGSGHLLSGQTIYLKLRGGHTIEDLFIRDSDGKAMGGMKMANGTNSRRDAPFPGTRAKSASLIREKYIKALAYKRKREAAKGDPSKMPPRDIGMDALVEVLEGKRIVHHHTHRQDDIMTVIRIAKEFHYRVVLHHVSEGWKVAKEIAAAGIPCSVILVDSPGGKLEARDLLLKCPGILEKAGVKVALHTDDWITDGRLFLRMAGMAVRAGMTRAGALKAVTLAGAEMIDLGNRIGSLDVGKDADFIILSGDPLSVYTKVLETWVEGHKVFDRSKPKDRLYAVGGYGAGHELEPYFCCFDHTEGQ